MKLIWILAVAKFSLGAEDTCSYTFVVPSDSATDVWPSRVTESRIQTLENTIANQQSLINYQQSQLQLLANRVSVIEGQPGFNLSGSDNSGTTYVRWGRTVCPSSSDLVYKGYTGKSYNRHGGGVNYQCLPEDPEWPDGATAGNQSDSFMYGVEYRSRFTPILPVETQFQDVPCAVCSVTGRSRLLMIPAKKTCPSGWTEEYSGLLVSQRYDLAGSTYECLDSDYEHDIGGAEYHSGGLFYVVEAICGSLPCPPYVNGYELACVVCTK